MPSRYLSYASVSSVRDDEQSLALGLPVWGSASALSLSITGGTGATALEGDMGRGYGTEAFTLDDPRIQPEPNTGCWLWVGSLLSTGYGIANGKVGGVQRTRRAHRLVWEKLRGPIPDGLVLDHLCRVRSCVNPDHLRAVTPRVNALENSASLCVVNAAKTACSKCGGPLRSYPHDPLHRECRARCTHQFYLVANRDKINANRRARRLRNKLRAALTPERTP